MKFPHFDFSPVEHPLASTCWLVHSSRVRQDSGREPDDWVRQKFFEWALEEYHRAGGDHWHNAFLGLDKNEQSRVSSEFLRDSRAVILAMMKEREEQLRREKVGDVVAKALGCVFIAIVLLVLIALGIVAGRLFFK